MKLMHISAANVLENVKAREDISISIKQEVIDEVSIGVCTFDPDTL